MPTFKEMNAAREAAVRFRYASEKYTPVALESLSNKEISRELSQARSILRKRAQRAMKKGLYTYEQARRVQDLLIPIKEIKMNDRQSVLSAIARELSLGATSVTAARTRRRQFIENFRNAGYDFINEENANEFMQFLSEFEWKLRDASFGSGVLESYFQEQKERQEHGDSVKISRSSFMSWLSKREGRYGTGISYKEGGKR